MTREGDLGNGKALVMGMGFWGRGVEDEEYVPELRVLMGAHLLRIY